MRKMPRIKVELILSSDGAEINDISCRMNIQSALTKTKFPPNSIANPFWCIQTEEVFCLSLEEPLYKLMNKLLDKKDDIKSICAKYNIKPVLQIVAYFNYENRPEMGIPSDIIAFLASINAEICIEPCID